MATATKSKTATPTIEVTEEDLVGFARTDRTTDVWERKELELALGLYRAGREGVCEAIPELEASIATGAAIARAWNELWPAIAEPPNAVAAEEEASFALFEAAGAGGALDVDEFATSVVTVARRVEVIEIAGRVVDGARKLAQRRVTSVASGDRSRDVIAEAIGRVVAEAREAVSRFPEGATERDVLRADREAADASCHSTGSRPDMQGSASSTPCGRRAPISATASPPAPAAC